jgi:hypothetical protein
VVAFWSVGSGGVEMVAVEMYCKQQQDIIKTHFIGNLQADNIRGYWQPCRADQL